MDEILPVLFFPMQAVHANLVEYSIQPRTWDPGWFLQKVSFYLTVESVYQLSEFVTSKVSLE